MVVSCQSQGVPLSAFISGTATIVAITACTNLMAGYTKLFLKQLVSFVKRIDLLVGNFALFSIPSLIRGITNESYNFPRRMNQSFNIKYIAVERLDKVAFSKLC